MPINKYNANQIRYYNPIAGSISLKRKSKGDYLFRSKLEFDFYIKLRDLIHESQIQVQYPLLIKPATSNYKARYWRVDFKIDFFNLKTKKRDELFLETKGYYNEVFIANLHYLEFFDKYAFDKLLIFGERSRNIDAHCVRMPMSKLKQVLEQHYVI